MNDRALYRLPLCLLRHKHLLFPEAFQLFDRQPVCLDALPTELLCNFVQTGSSKGTVLSQRGGQPFESGYEIVIDDVGKSYQVKQVRQGGWFRVPPFYRFQHDPFVHSDMLLGGAQCDRFCSSTWLSMSHLDICEAGI